MLPVQEAIKQALTVLQLEMGEHAATRKVKASAVATTPFQEVEATFAKKARAGYAPWDQLPTGLDDAEDAISQYDSDGDRDMAQPKDLADQLEFSDALDRLRELCQTGQSSEQPSAADVGDVHDAGDDATTSSRGRPAEVAATKQRLLALYRRTLDPYARGSRN